MKTRYFAIVFALVAAPAFAGNFLSPQELAAETGLTARQVSMVLGPHSAYPEYLSSYSIVRDRFIRAVGQQRYNELAKLYRDKQSLRAHAVASSDAARNPGS